MKLIQYIREGFSSVWSNKRLIAFLWVANCAVALVVAIPMLRQIDRAVTGTGREQELLERFDVNWYRTFMEDSKANEVTRSFDYSVFGAGPFIHHADRMLAGGVADDLSTFLVRLITKFRLDVSMFGLLGLLAILYAAMSSFLAGGLISAYWNGASVRIAEFLADGGRFFGRFLRLSIFGLLVSGLALAFLEEWGGGLIFGLTVKSASEMAPFLLYLVRAGMAAFVVACVVLSLDYAKVLIVSEDRVSAFAAFFSGIAFAFRNFGRTFPLLLVLTAFGIALMALYGWVEAMFPQTTYWSIAAVFAIQQAYMVLRMTLKAGFIGCETALVREVEAERTSAYARV